MSFPEQLGLRGLLLWPSDGFKVLGRVAFVHDG